MANLLARYGLLAVFVGAVFEGDVTLILAGVLAHLDLTDLRAAAAVGCLGAFVADCSCYAIGRARRTAVLRSRLYQRLAPVIDGLVARIGPWELLITRFVYGTRLASMLFWGIRGLPLALFVLLDLVGCAAWAAALASLGYAFSGSAVVVVGKVRRAERWLLVALLLAAVSVFVARRAMRRRLAARRSPSVPRPNRGDVH
jgi:membrane protein DedA with SNARE-associated domain